MYVYRVSTSSPDPDREQALRMHLTGLIRGAREQMGLSQAAFERALAAALGVEGLGAMTLSRYERGDRVPSWGTLAAICEVVTGRKEALAEGVAAAFERLPAPSARKRKESP